MNKKSRVILYGVLGVILSPILLVCFLAWLPIWAFGNTINEFLHGGEKIDGAENKRTQGENNA